MHIRVFGFQCAEKYKVPWKLILNCAKGVEGDWFLKKYGELTVKLKPRMTFVPTILLNQVNDSFFDEILLPICPFY